MPFISSIRGSLSALGRRRALPPQARGNYFGNGSDGALSTSGNVTLTVPNKSGSYNGDYVVAQYTSLTVNSGHTLTVDQPCKGLFIYVDGNCTINGTISMRARGAAQNPDSILNTNGIQYPVLTANGAATLSAADFAGCGSGITTAVANQEGISGNGTIIRISKRGASGGAGVPADNGVGKTGNAGGAGGVSLSSSIATITLGAGGGGGSYSDTNSCTPGCSPGGLQNGVSYKGGNATAFSGGPGGGGKMSGQQCQTAGSAGDDNGGAGGNGGNGHCGGVHSVTGGCGNPGGTDRYGSTSQPGNNQNAGTGSAGTGGVVWLVVKGNLTIGAGGSIDVRGTDNATSGRELGGVYGGGGGSGAGTVILLYTGTFTNNGTLNLAGGAGFSTPTGANGGAGGAGGACILQISAPT